MLIYSVLFFDKEIKKINDNLKDEFDGSKQLIDNLTKKKVIIEIKS